MSKLLVINKKINKFNKIIKIEGDKSLSIRCALLASQAKGKSTIKNLLKSDDVLSTIKCLKKLGVKIKGGDGVRDVLSPGQCSRECTDKDGCLCPEGCNVERNDKMITG